MKRPWLVAGSLLPLLPLLAVAPILQSHAAPNRPDIVLLLTDDQTIESATHMPYLQQGVRNGTYISMVVGMTFDDWMESILGPSWADFLFT